MPTYADDEWTQVVHDEAVLCRLLDREGESEDAATFERAWQYLDAFEGTDSAAKEEGGGGGHALGGSSYWDKLLRERVEEEEMEQAESMGKGERL